MSTKNTSSKKKVNKTLLQAIEHVVELSSDSKLSRDFLHNAKSDISFLAKSYGITEMQAILFCICIEKGPNRIDYDDIAHHLDISKIKVLGFASDIDALVHRRLLKYRNAKDEEDFDIPIPVIRCLKHNEVYQPPKRTGLDCSELFELMGIWFEDLSNSAISSKEMQEELQTLFDDNPQIGFVRKMKQLGLCTEHLLMLAFFCCCLVNKDDDNITLYQLDDLFDSRSDCNSAKALLRSGDHRLMRLELIEHRCEDGIADTSRFRLTAEAKRNLLEELKIVQVEEKIADLLNPDDLTKKQMFYPKDVEKQVAELTSLLNPNEFNKIQKRMKEKGFRNGYACMFYGAPGTGKTETVYQLALQTGRSIMVVDVPQIKSKWVGDSEKNIKALFDRYREKVKSSKVTPILLFNEADAIIGIRQEGASNAVDKMENSIQNIILQEMESLDGIMIATTNLQKNLDKAFERRFLYKIRFEKPDAETRAHIWQAMIPELNDCVIHTLATKYDFSGGQIENIARHYTIDSILHGDQANKTENLYYHCDNERMNERGSRKLGF